MNNDELQELKQRKINQIRAAQCKAVFLENCDSKDFECIVKNEFIEIQKKGCYQFPVFRVPIDFDYTNGELLQFAKIQFSDNLLKQELLDGCKDYAMLVHNGRIFHVLEASECLSPLDSLLKTTFKCVRKV